MFSSFRIILRQSSSTTSNAIRYTVGTSAGDNCIHLFRRLALSPCLFTGQYSSAFRRCSSRTTTGHITNAFRTYTSTLHLQKVMHNSNLTDEEAEALMNEHISKYEQEQADKLNAHKTWKPGHRKRPLRMSYRLQDFADEIKPSKWRPHLDKRSGALGIKLGMMPLWDDYGKRHPCTVLYIHHNIVTDVRTEKLDGYIAVQIGAGIRKAKNVTKPLLGHYAKLGLDIKEPPYIVREFRVSDSSYLPKPGTVIHARHFVPGQAVDISGITKGKGFQGAMKRHGFRGLPASHGTTKSHRSLGSTGQCQDPGKVFKGKKMAGRMGATRHTTQNLQVVMVDRGRNLIFVRGGVSGQKGQFVEIRDAVKKPLFGTEHVKMIVNKNDDQNENIDADDMHDFPPLPTWNIQEGVDGCRTGGYEIIMPCLQGEEPLYPQK